MNTHEEVLKITEDLIRFRSTANHLDQLNACADYITSYFEGTDLVVTQLERNGKKTIIVTKGTKTPTIFLYGHYDVVDGDDEQFEPTCESDWLYGRGSMDMKSSVAIFMVIMKQMAENDFSVGAMFTPDEEIGGKDGLQYALDEGYSSRIMILPDGGDQIDKIVAGEKGLIRLKLFAKGKAAHGSRTWLGTSAITLLNNAIEKLQSLFTPVAGHPDGHWVHTYNVGRLDGGTTWNQVPDTAMADGDIRFTEETKANQLLSQIEDVLPEGVTMSSEVLSHGVDVDIEHQDMKAFVSLVEARGKTVEFVRTHGRSDASLLAHTDILPIVCQPLGEHLHARGERVSISAMKEFFEVVETYIAEVAQ